MNKKLQAGLIILLAAGAAGLIWFILHRFGFGTVAVLQPQGTIANQQRDLMKFAGIFMLIVGIPVFIMTFGFAWRYRASNRKATYTPNWDHNLVAETVWWTIPSIIIVILAVVAWTSSHQLDPFKPLDSKVKPITIQVVALDWKWLFIYPAQGIATVNYVQFPAGTPVNFVITADAPMNSFWIPQLAGQVYAMAGMTTQLHLMADHAGSYNGLSANISGEGFADMRFVATSTSQADFDHWVAVTKLSPTPLTMAEYDKLAEPSLKNPVSTYTLAAQDLQQSVIMKFMSPQTASQSTDVMSMSGMDMLAPSYGSNK